MGAVPGSSEQPDGDSCRADAAALLAGLSANTDLARLIERVSRHRLAVVVVAENTLSAWQARDPAGWAKVVEWLAARGVTIARV